MVSKQKEISLPSSSKPLSSKKPRAKQPSNNESNSNKNPHTNPQPLSQHFKNERHMYLFSKILSKSFIPSRNINLEELESKNFSKNLKKLITDIGWFNLSTLNLSIYPDVWAEFYSSFPKSPVENKNEVYSIINLKFRLNMISP